MALEVKGYEKHLKVCGLEKAQHPVGVRRGRESEGGRENGVYTLCPLGVRILPPTPNRTTREAPGHLCTPAAVSFPYLCLLVVIIDLPESVWVT